ncbi:MAG: hypothetical protein U1E59_19960 [Amaricoccus sp.]
MRFSRTIRVIPAHADSGIGTALRPETSSRGRISRLLEDTPDPTGPRPEGLRASEAWGAR